MDGFDDPSARTPPARRHALVSAIFERVCDLPPAERDEELARACRGDAGLRAAVEALLEADGRPHDADWLETPVAVVVPPRVAAPRTPAVRRIRTPLAVTLLVTCTLGIAAWVALRVGGGSGADDPALLAAARRIGSAAEASEIEPDLRRSLAATLAVEGPAGHHVLELSAALARCLARQGRSGEAAELAHAARELAAETLPPDDPLLGELQDLALPGASHPAGPGSGG